MKIYLRHYQLREDNGTPYWYDGVTPDTVQKVFSPPIGFTNKYVEYTADTLNLGEIAIVYENGDDDQHLKLALSDDFDFGGDAALFIRDWLAERPYSALNIVQVKLYSDACQRTIGEFLIKPQKISYCDTGDCSVSVAAESDDTYFRCLERTKLTDNWNNILDQDFRAWDYAVEKRPAVMTALFYTLGALIGVIVIPLIPLGALVNAFIAGLNFLLSLPPFAFIGNPQISFTVPTFDDYVNWMLSLVGLGRVHGAASVRDYTDNTCGKCGIVVDTDNHVFYRPFVGGDPNPYLNADILFAETDKGRKRDSPNKRKLKDINVPVISLTDLYAKLSKLFNSKWYLSGNTLRFIPKTEFSTPILELDGKEKGLEICSDISPESPPLVAQYGYFDDAIDYMTQDARPRFNSRAVYDDDDSPNPIFKGVDDRRAEFGASRFLDDGIREDYIDQSTNDPIVFLGVFAILLLLIFQLANIVTAVAGANPLNPNPLVLAVGAVWAVMLLLLVPLVTSAALYFGTSFWLDSIYSNVLMMSQDTCQLPKILIWDGDDPEQARAISYGDGTTLQPNTLFNPIPETYAQVHPYNEETPNLRNYPMFLDCRFQENLHWYFWNESDLRTRAVAKREVRVVFYPCCDTLEALGLFDTLVPAIDRTITFPADTLPIFGNNNNEFRIERIEINHTTGRVELSGLNVN